MVRKLKYGYVFSVGILTWCLTAKWHRYSVHILMLNISWRALSAKSEEHRSEKREQGCSNSLPAYFLWTSFMWWIYSHVTFFTKLLSEQGIMKEPNSECWCSSKICLYYLPKFWSLGEPIFFLLKLLSIPDQESDAVGHIVLRRRG